jgi:uncharacterized protein with von Willebrand factor type A (vWA) domain
MGAAADDHDVDEAGAAVLAMLLRLLGELRSAHVDVAMVEVLDAAEALRHLDLADRVVLRHALQATLVKHLEDEALFDVLFDRCFPLTRPGAGASGLATTADGDHDPAAPRATASPAPPPRGSASPDSRDVETEDVDLRTDLLEALLAALRTGDLAALQSIAAEAVGTYSGLGQASGSERYFLYRVLRALDLAALLSRAMRAEREAAPGGPGQELALRLRRDELARRIDDFRRMLAQELRLQQLQLHDPAPAPPRRLDELDLLDASTLDRRAMRQAVRPLARKLAARVAQRRRLHRGGRLDVRRTIRRSLSAGGTPIDPAFRRRKTSKPDVVVLCDLSGSVAEFAEFTLTLVHALHAELARLRSFVFVDGIAEVTALLDATGGEVDAWSLLRQPGVVTGDGHSDYGQVLTRFWERHAGTVVGSSTTVILTGDARSNHRPAGLDAFGLLCRKAKRVYWLNPEPRREWDTLDSMMGAYGPTCTKVFEVRNLRQLGEAVAEIV